MSLDKNGAQLKYGIIQGEEACVRKYIPIAASIHIPAGGCFAKTDASGRATPMSNGDGLILCWIYPNETGLDVGKLYETTSATAGAEPFCPAIFANGMLNAVVRLPIYAGTFVQNMVGQIADLKQASMNGNLYAQGVDLTADSEEVVIIVGGDLINNKWVDVMVNPSKLTGQTGV